MFQVPCYVPRAQLSPTKYLTSEPWFTYTINMSKTQAQKYIWMELSHLNEIIDRKIIQGESYHREALRHRALLAKMRILESEASWFRAFNKLIYR